MLYIISFFLFILLNKVADREIIVPVELTKVTFWASQKETYCNSFGLIKENKHNVIFN